MAVDRVGSTPRCIAHRGASAHAPENTLAAVRHAVAQGADAVEIDVQRTADGVLVAVHDIRLIRTTDVVRRFPGRLPWDVGRFTLAELRTLDAGGWRSPAHRGERIPTLHEVLDTLRGTGVDLLLELKAPHLYPGIADQLAGELVERHATVVDPAEARVVVQSFDWRVAAQLRALVPHLRIGLLGSPAAHALADLRWADQVNPRWGTVNAAWVRTAHDLGLQVHVWTLDETTAIRTALGYGVDGVISNRPALVRQLIDSPARVPA